jgi:hypothetical protein
MSTGQTMQSARRRTIPGMVSQAPDRREAAPAEDQGVSRGSDMEAAGDLRAGAEDRRRSVDYSVTRLVNFRLPVDVHDRFRALVREAEDRHPRLRKASLTELVIALLEEGPQSADDVADVIRRKRMDEHEEH